MATIKLLLGIFCLGIVGSTGLFKHHLLKPQDQNTAQRAKLISIATNEIGVHEKTNHNDGRRVEEYLAVAGLKRGDPWCAAYLSWVFARADYKKPRSGWCPDWFPVSRLARSALPGNVLGIYFSELKRIAHVGMILSVRDDWITSVEGNTNVSGSREGEGVYVRVRHRKTIYRIADWVSERRQEP